MQVPDVAEEAAAVSAAAAEAPADAAAMVAAPAAAAAAPKASAPRAQAGGKPAGRVGKHIGAPVAKSRLLVNRRKSTWERALAYIQQQLPKSQVLR